MTRPDKDEEREERIHMEIIVWNHRQFAVPLMHLEGIQVDEETQQAIEDWH